MFVLNKKSFLFFSIVLIVGVICGLILASRLDFMPQTQAQPRLTVGQADVGQARQTEGGQEKQEATPAPTTPAESLESSFVKVAEEIGPAVVSISTEHTEKISKRQFFGPQFRDEFFDEFFKEFFEDMPEREFKQRGLGSGFIIDEDGYILTNEHVVSGADKITVTLPDGREFKGTIKGTDPRSDLAVIKIDAKNLPVAKLGNSDEVKIGQWSIAVGNPFGWAMSNPKPTVTVGVISALDRSLPRTQRRDRDYSGLVQTDAAINPGNSGGPLVNIKGEVIAINVAIYTTSGGYQGVGFAIPINQAKLVIGDLIAGKKILYGWLGVNVQEIDQTLADYFGLTDKEGVVVVKVLKDSPAEKGGLKPQDIIRTFDGKKVKTLRDLLRTVGHTEVGKNVKVEIIRDKKPLSLEIKIGERPSEMQEYEKVSEETWRGIEVSEITPQLAQRYRIEEKEGVFISGVEPNSPADNASLRIGDVIYEINGQPIKNISDYNKVTSIAKGDVLVKTTRGFAVVKEKVE